MARLGELEAAIGRLVDDAVALRYVGMGLEGERGSVGAAIRRIATRFEKKLRGLIEDIMDLRIVMEGEEDDDSHIFDLWRERQTLVTALARDKGHVPDDDPRLAQVHELTQCISLSEVCTLAGTMTVLRIALDEVNDFRGAKSEVEETAAAQMIRGALRFLERRYEAGGGQKSAAA